MVFHSIAIYKVKDHALGYVFSSENLAAVRADLKILRSDARVAHVSGYALHSLTTDSHDIQSIVEYDNYFEGVQFTSSKSDFITQLKAQLYPSSLEVAAYIQKKFSLGAFALLKTVYYLYADYLEANGKPLFSAEFKAWDEGPVDSSVYSYNKYEFWEKKDDIRVKQIDGFDILEYIDKFVKKNATYLNSVRFTEENPTHNPGTPWSIVKKTRGQNGLITDDDIIKYHKAEKILV